MARNGRETPLASAQGSELRLLGSLEVEDDGRVVEIGGQKQRAVLAILALNAGRVVSTDDSDHLSGGESPPRTAVTSLQELHLAVTEGAWRRGRRHEGPWLSAGRRAGSGRPHSLRAARTPARPLEPEAAAKSFVKLSSSGADPPLAEFTFEPFAETEIARLEELRAGAVEERIEADLDEGGAAELVGELEGLVRGNPLRERLAAS